MNRDQFYFFWSGPFSQWKHADIIIDGQLYNCNEQYMMAEKARLFKDDHALAKIMSTDEPAVQKLAGRNVVGFDKVQWEQIARLVVYRANFAKFTQHADLYKLLMATEHKVIVEASPKDPIWGIGMSENDPDVTDPSKWKGTNWLGEAIMQVRNDIRQMPVDFDF